MQGTGDGTPIASIARMVDEFVRDGRSAAADETFIALDKPVPEIRWRPAMADLPVEGLRFLLDYWQQAKGGSALPPVGAIDPFALKPVLGDIIVLDVEGDGRDFRYRLYGTNIAESARFDWTGSTVGDMRRVLKGPGPDFYLAIYRAVLQRREPVYTLSPAIVVFSERSWARLVLPFGDPIQRILVGNYAVGADFLSHEDERKLEELRDAMRARRSQD